MPTHQRLARHFVQTAPWRWAVLGGLLGLVIALVLCAPATWLAAAIQRASAGQIELVQSSGTVWAGSAQLQITGGVGSRDRTTLPSPIVWRFSPSWLALHVQVSAGCCTAVPLRFQLSPRWSGVGIQVFDGHSQWPASLLAGLGTPWNTVQPSGSLQLRTQGLSLVWQAGRLSVSGQAELAALALSSRLSTLRPMGSYRLVLVGGAAPTLQLTTLEGSLQLSGSGNWAGSRLRFNGVASAAPEHEAALSNLLNIIGRRSGARSVITLG